MFYGVACQIDNENQLEKLVNACDVCKCTTVDAIETNLESYIEIECVYNKDKELALNSLTWPVSSQKNIAMSIVGFEISSVQK